MSDFEGQVGISDELSIPVSATVYRGGATMVIVFSIVVLVVAIALAMLYFRMSAAPAPLPSAPPTPRTPVLEAYCQECGNGVYRPETHTCACRPAFSGANCNVERVAIDYHDVGSAAGRSPLVVQALSSPTINSLSLGNNSCTQACDADPLCAAVQYSTGGACQSQPLCSLLSSVLVPRNAALVHSDDTQSSLYVKDPLKVIFANRVIVAASVSSFPNNYPKVYSAPGYSQHLLNRVWNLDFFPEIAISPANYVGVYSLAPFTIDQIPTMASSKNTFFVIGNPLLPSSWKGRRIYVAYAPKATVPI